MTGKTKILLIVFVVLFIGIFFLLVLAEYRDDKNAIDNRWYLTVTVDGQVVERVESIYRMSCSAGSFGKPTRCVGGGYEFIVPENSIVKIGRINQ
jgi:hypothetical protein